MVNLDNNLILKSENIEYNGKTLKDFLDESVESQFVIEGQEIALNEYTDGKRVYRLYKNLGTMPEANGKTSFNTGLSESYQIQRYQLFAIRKNDKKQVLSIPFINLDNTTYISGYMDSTKLISVGVNWNTENYDLYVDVYYTK